jgi:hypothetical protein
VDAAALGDVDHVERDHERQPGVEQLRHEVEVALEVARVDDGEDSIRA